MPKSQHEDTYLKLTQEKKAHPDTSYTALCKKYGVKYINYRNWYKTYERKAKSAAKAAPASKQGLSQPSSNRSITIRLNITDIVDALYNKKPVVLKDRALTAAIDPAQLAVVERILGARLLKDGHSQGHAPVLDPDDEGFHAKSDLPPIE